MELTDEVEKQVCPRCGNTEYDSATGNCPVCGWRADAEEPVIPEVRQDLYLDKRICPVCGKSELLMEGSSCKVCGWLNDLVQAEDPDEECGLNDMSLNQARDAYAKGLPIS
ncbi:MAG: CPCC family cysteine-rich protein [Oscillospiraceae bacterium]|nr:CPCC family cysteine-rich protein [Oscillospiraceae bacterium]